MGPDAFQPLRDGLRSDDADRAPRVAALHRQAERARAARPGQGHAAAASEHEGSGDGTVRAVAATYLGIIGSRPEQAVPALTTGLLDDESRGPAGSGHRARRVRRRRGPGAAGAQEGQRRSQSRRRARSGPGDVEGAAEVAASCPCPTGQSPARKLAPGNAPCTQRSATQFRTSTTSRYRSSASPARWSAALKNGEVIVPL